MIHLANTVALTSKYIKSLTPPCSGHCSHAALPLSPLHPRVILTASYVVSLPASSSPAVYEHGSQETMSDHIQTSYGFMTSLRVKTKRSPLLPGCDTGRDMSYNPTQFPHLVPLKHSCHFLLLKPHRLLAGSETHQARSVSRSLHCAPSVGKLVLSHPLGECWHSFADERGLRGQPVLSPHSPILPHTTSSLILLYNIILWQLSSFHTHLDLFVHQLQLLPECTLHQETMTIL